MTEEFDEIVENLKKHGACDKLKGISTWKQLIDAFFTPYGLEFIHNTGYPSIHTFRRHRSRIATRGIFVDAGELSFSNSTNVGLIGKTSATLKYSGVDALNTVVVMDGATANIEATKYAVIKVYNLGGKVNINNDKTVRIL